MLLKKYTDFLFESKDYLGYIDMSTAQNLQPGEKLYISGYYFKSTGGGFADFEKGPIWYTEPVMFLMLSEDKNRMLIFELNCNDDITSQEILNRRMEFLDTKSILFRDYHYCLKWINLNDMDFDPDNGFFFGKGSDSKYFKFKDSSKNIKNNLMKSYSATHQFNI